MGRGHSRQVYDRPCESSAGPPKPEGRRRIAQRFIAGNPAKKKEESREGRKNALRLAPAFFRPCRGLALFRTRVPTVETVGYDRSSLWDYLACTAGTSPPVWAGGRKNGHAPTLVCRMALRLVTCYTCPELNQGCCYGYALLVVGCVCHFGYLSSVGWTGNSGCRSIGGVSRSALVGAAGGVLGVAQWADGPGTNDP
jgi:hypothetical protein